MSAQNLIATVSAAFASGLGSPIQLLSTNLSTDFCGYRGLRFNLSLREGPRASIDAMRKLARRGGLA
jgi:hypothetical protein